MRFVIFHTGLSDYNKNNILLQRGLITRNEINVPKRTGRHGLWFENR